MNDIEKETRQTAEESLKLAAQAEEYSLHRTLPPKWLLLLISVCTGGCIAASTAGSSGLIPVFLGAMFGAIYHQNNKNGASPLPLIRGKQSIIFLSVLLPSAAIIMYGIRYAQQTYGANWAPLAGGFILSIAFYLLTLQICRKAIDSSKAGTDSE